MLAELALAVTSVTGAGTGMYAYRLFHQLHTDPLTGLANRAQMHRLFARAARHRRQGSAVAVLLGDVNRFKQFNDTYGHRFGDRVLQTIAAELAASTEPGELAVRLHGDEFAVLLTRPDAAQVAETRAAALRGALSGTRVIDGQPVELSISIGAATTPLSTSGALSQLLSRADERMYRTKPTSRSSVGLTPVEALT